MSNKRMWLDELSPGMKLAAPVTTSRHHVLVAKDTILTKKIIEMLKKQTENLTVLIQEEDLPSTLSSWEKEVRQNYKMSVNKVKRIFDLARENKEVNVPDIIDLATTTVEQLVQESYVLQSLKFLNSHDEYTYHHSINVGVLCGVLGKWLKYDKEDLFTLVLSGILHDIGKSQIPLAILNKPDKLSKEEMSVMKQHTIRGYEMMKDIAAIPQAPKLAAIQHHEKVDGTGYPFALKGRDISDIAKIVAVADTYDAVTSDRIYQKARSPFSVIEIFEEEMFIRLDSKICLPMLSQIKHTLIGRQVIMEDGRRAKIVFIGSQSSDYMILKAEDGEVLTYHVKDYKRFQDA